MEIATLLPLLLGIAWLVPLASFVAILFFGNRMAPMVVVAVMGGGNEFWSVLVSGGSDIVSPETLIRGAIQSF